MPLQWAHALYWDARANPVVSPEAGLGGQYPQWHATVMTASLFGGLAGAPWRRWRHTLRWWGAWLRASWRLGGEARGVLLHLTRHLATPAWPHARLAVWQTSTTPKFHRPEAWIPYSRLIKANLGRAENIFRHVKARELLAAAVPSLSAADCALLVELAYAAHTRIRPDAHVQ